MSSYGQQNIMMTITKAVCHLLVIFWTGMVQSGCTECNHMPHSLMWLYFLINIMLKHHTRYKNQDQDCQVTVCKILWPEIILTNKVKTELREPSHSQAAQAGWDLTEHTLLTDGCSWFRVSERVTQLTKNFCEGWRIKCNVCLSLS